MPAHIQSIQQMGFTYVFSIVGYMAVEFLHVSREESGYYAGMVASSQMLGMAIGALGWGRVADTWGRRPVVLIGCVAVALSAFIVGIAESFWVIVAARFVGGLFNAILPTAKTLTAEVSNEVFVGPSVGPSVGHYMCVCVISTNSTQNEFVDKRMYDCRSLATRTTGVWGQMPDACHDTDHGRMEFLAHRVTFAQRHCHARSSHARVVSDDVISQQ
jgi:hypothetical protein